jgi:hypothetical protein
MPTHNTVRLHDDQGRSPILPRLGKQDPKHTIARAEVRTPDRASEDGQLLTQRHVLERDGSVSTTEQPERSKQNHKRGQHALSCRPIDRRINRRVADQALANHNVAALFQATRFFVEKNIIEREEVGSTSLELDAVATSYVNTEAETILIEAKGGDWGFTDLFKVLSWMTYLRLTESVLFAAKPIPGKAPATITEKFKGCGVKCVHLGDFSNVGVTFEAAGFPKIADPDVVEIWRFAYRIERLLIDRLHKLAKTAPRTGPKEAMKYHNLINKASSSLPTFEIGFAGFTRLTSCIPEYPWRSRARSREARSTPRRRAATARPIGARCSMEPTTRFRRPSILSTGRAWRFSRRPSTPSRTGTLRRPSPAS